MKWWPCQCSCGDMVRVQLGSIHHYGVFVSEQEVIQFGLPPLVVRDERDITVCATDMQTFCCGRIPEVAVLDRSEQRKRLAPEKTVALARARLGEGGYSLLHNNCEHFAYECVLGTRKSAQQDTARRKWNARPILDIYMLPFSDTLERTALYPPERDARVRQMQNPRAQLESYAVWKALECAVRHSFGYAIGELSFHRERSGKWTCDGLHFSLAHTRGFAVAAVSDAPCGVDAESAADFLQKYPDGTCPEALFRKICTPREAQLACTPENFLTLWTKKESLYKAGTCGSFNPRSFDTEKARTQTKCVQNPRIYLSACGRSDARWYLVENGRARAAGENFFRNE